MHASYMHSKKGRENGINEKEKESSAVNLQQKRE
jgi:hypothetical protein